MTFVNFHIPFLQRWPLRGEEIGGIPGGFSDCLSVLN